MPIKILLLCDNSVYSAAQRENILKVGLPVETNCTNWS
jgi:hypothetical protein